MPLLDATDLVNIAAVVKAAVPSLSDIMYSALMVAQFKSSTRKS